MRRTRALTFALVLGAGACRGRLPVTAGVSTDGVFDQRPLAEQRRE